MFADGKHIQAELIADPSNMRQTIASDHRSAICLVIEPESVRVGAFDELARRLSGPDGEIIARRVRTAYQQLLQRRCRDDISNAEFDVMCFCEALPQGSLDPRVVRAIAQIGRL